jgi:hypothetical protein
MEEEISIQSIFDQMCAQVDQIDQQFRVIAKSLASAITPEQDEAVDRVTRNAEPEWLLSAASAIYILSQTNEGAFTTDDVWKLLEQWEVEPPHEPRAMGGAIKTAQATGRIKATGSYVRSERPGCHGRPVMVWSAA